MHVFERTEYNRDEKNGHGNGHHPDVYVAVGKPAYLAADEQKICRNRGQNEERIVYQAVIQRKFSRVRPAVEQAELFAAAPEQQKELVYGVLRRIGERTAEKHGFIRLVEAKFCVRGGEREQEHVYGYSAIHRAAVKIIEKRHAESYGKHGGKPRKHFKPKARRAAQPGHYYGIKYIQLGKELHHHPPVDDGDFCNHSPPP